MCELCDVASCLAQLVLQKTEGLCFVFVFASSSPLVAWIGITANGIQAHHCHGPIEAAGLERSQLNLLVTSAR